jgi:hypothetical protein
MSFYFISLFNSWLFMNNGSKADNNTSMYFINYFFEKLAEWRCKMPNSGQEIFIWIGANNAPTNCFFLNTSQIVKHMQ